jgi:hypothetical protein
MPTANIAALDERFVRSAESVTDRYDGKTAPLGELLDELMAVQLQRSVALAASHQGVPSTPSRRARDAQIGRNVPHVRPAAFDPEGSARMDALRSAIVSELSRHQGVPDPTGFSDVSPYASEVFSLQSPTTRSPQQTPRQDHLSLSSLGERVKPTKPFGKRVFDGGIPVPLPPGASGRSPRYSKRMHIEMEAKRRVADSTAMHTRKPDHDSIFADRYAVLRRGILNVDDHRPAVRLPSVERDQRRTMAPGLPGPVAPRAVPATSSYTNTPRSEAQVAYQRAAMAAQAPPTTRTGGILPVAPPPIITRSGVSSSQSPRNYLASSASGALLQQSARPLVADPSAAGRRPPATERTYAVVA